MARKKKPIPITTLLFIILPALVVIIAFIRIITASGQYVYAKINVSQGLWWASTNKPNYWFIESLKVGEQEKDLSGKISAELLGFTYYPDITQKTETTYNIYLVVKLNVKKTKEGGLLFNRDKIGVGSPIELNFPSVLITGAVMQLSDEPIEDEYVTKMITLTGKDIFPWQYSAIKIGDTYFDGEQEVFKIIDKQALDTWTLARDTYGNISTRNLENRKYVIAKAEVRLKETKDGKLFFGEEQEIMVGMPFGLKTPNFNYYLLDVGKLE